jgi:hypothetical protein
MPFRPWGFCGELRRRPGLVGILWGEDNTAQPGSPATRSTRATPTARRAGQDPEHPLPPTPASLHQRVTTPGMPRTDSTHLPNISHSRQEVWRSLCDAILPDLCATAFLVARIPLVFDPGVTSECPAGRTSLPAISTRARRPVAVRGGNDPRVYAAGQLLIDLRRESAKASPRPTWQCPYVS